MVFKKTQQVVISSKEEGLVYCPKQWVICANQELELKIFHLRNFLLEGNEVTLKGSYE